MELAPSKTASAHPRFPPAAVFRKFMDVVEAAARASGADHADLWLGLNDHDRSQVRGAFFALGIMRSDGTLDELLLRSLANPRRRPQACRRLLEEFYGTQLDLIRQGTDRETLRRTLAVPARSSRSAVEKAGQFFEHLLVAAELGMAPTISRSRKTSRTEAPRPPHLREEQVLNAHLDAVAPLTRAIERAAEAGQSVDELARCLDRILAFLRSGSPLDSR